MMWIRTPNRLRVNLAALAYAHEYTNERGGVSVKVGFIAAGAMTDGTFSGDVVLATDHYHGEDAAALLASIDMLAEGRA